jgi:hypothetical protein
VEAAELRPAAVPTLRDVPGPTPLPIFGTRWIFNSLFSDYKFDKIHEAYSGAKFFFFAFCNLQIHAIFLF